MSAGTRFFACALGVFTASACVENLPPVPDENFACESDALFGDDELQCPETHWCRPTSGADGEGACRPRLDCNNQMGRPGCAPLTSRCNLRNNGLTAAVVCESGLHETTTSTTPADFDRCECPDGTHCVALANMSGGENFGLFLLKEGGALPVGSFGVESEQPLGRLCVHVCSNEVDCPANHTCRAAPVLDANLLAETSSSRKTIGVCYPNVLPTSSTSVGQPLPFACTQGKDCEKHGGRSVCRASVVPVSDHPSVPAEEAWGSERLSILTECVTEPGGTQTGLGCSENLECRTGVCHEGRCRALCDPKDPICTCRDLVVSRKLPGSSTVLEERLYLCPAM